MKLRTKWTLGLLGLGLALAPALNQTARADDPPKDPPAKKDAPGGQGGQGRGGRRGPGDMLDRFKASVEKLDLTADQKTKIDAAFSDAKPKVDAAIKDAGEDRAAVREKVQPILEKLRTDVEAVLTQDQKDKLQKAREEARSRRGGPGGGPGGGQKPQDPPK